MSLRAGRLNRRIRLERPTFAQDAATGEMVPTWVNDGEVWAAIEPSSVREFLAAQATQSEIDTKLVIRYRPDVRATWRAIHIDNGADAEIYNIHGALRDKETGLEYMILPCSTGANPTGE